MMRVPALTLIGATTKGLVTPKVSVPVPILVIGVTAALMALVVMLIAPVPAGLKVRAKAEAAVPPVMFKVEPVSAPMVAAEPRVRALEMVLVKAPTLCSEPPLLMPLPLIVNVPALLKVTPLVSWSVEPTAFETVRGLALALRLFAPAIWIAPPLIVHAPVRPVLLTPLAKARMPLSFFCKVLVAKLKVKAVSRVAVAYWVTSMPVAAALRLIVRPVSE